MKTRNERNNSRQNDNRERDNNGKFSDNNNYTSGSHNRRDTSYFRGSQNADTSSSLMDYDQEYRRGRNSRDEQQSDYNSNQERNANRSRDDNSDFSERDRRNTFRDSDGGNYSHYSNGQYGNADYGNDSFSNYGNGNYGTRSNADFQNNDENEWGGHSQPRVWDNHSSAESTTRQSHRGKGPKGYKRSDDRIREDISDWYTNDHQLDASDVELTVEQGEVTLSGNVSSRNDKRRAEDIAESVSGVTHVQNNIRIKRDTSSDSVSGESKHKTNGKR